MPINQPESSIALEVTPAGIASEVVLGRLLGIDNSGRPLVSFVLGDYQANGVVALSTQPLRQQDVGRQLALLFAGGQAQNPVIMGFIHSPLTDVLLSQESATADERANSSRHDHEQQKSLSYSGDEGVAGEETLADFDAPAIDSWEPKIASANQESDSSPQAGALANLVVTRSETETRIDGKRLVFAAEEEVVIQCGEASIVLNKNGKVTIRGKYLMSRATGVNRILGGSVQVN